MHNNNQFNSKNHAVQKSTFFKNLTRSSSFCRIKVNPKKFRNISFKFKKSDKVCSTPDYAVTTTSSAAASQVRGTFEYLILLINIFCFPVSVFIRRKTYYNNFIENWRFSFSLPFSLSLSFLHFITTDKFLLDSAPSTSEQCVGKKFNCNSE